MEISVIIPAFNEEKRIGDFLKKLTKFLGHRDYNSEIIIVDDGSEDRTVEVVKSIESNARIVRHKTNKGKGEAIKTGIKNAGLNNVLFMDADGSAPPSQIDKILPPLEGYDIVVGSRRLENSEIIGSRMSRRKVSSLFFNNLTRFLFRLNFSDFLCGFKALRKGTSRDIFGRIGCSGWAFDVEFFILAQVLGYSVKEVPIKWITKKQSKLSLHEAVPEILKDLFVLRRKY